MGFRPEDARIVELGSGLFDATVYAAEPTGDVTLVTLLVGKESLSVKMPKNYYVDFDSKVAVRFPLERGFLFDANSGKRLALQLGIGAVAGLKLIRSKARSVTSGHPSRSGTRRWAGKWNLKSFGCPPEHCRTRRSTSPVFALLVIAAMV